MAVFCTRVDVPLSEGVDMADISAEVARAVEESGIRNGVVSLFVEGSTGSLTTIEYEPGVAKDLKRAINRLAPPGEDYEHEKAWHDGNGHSHVQAALLGPSLCMAVRGGKVAAGTWQQAVVVNHDVRKRTRRVHVTVIGE
ncbi:MAG: YjbQ family protein [Deltaproteobacteria bacterium]|nr:YjbQ family protein [Deltaproteobacteria bacterium]